MRKIQFIKDFANKTKDDVFECDSMLASQLVNEEKVAKYIDTLEESEDDSTVKKAKKK